MFSGTSASCLRFHANHGRQNGLSCNQGQCKFHTCPSSPPSSTRWPSFSGPPLSKNLSQNPGISGSGAVTGCVKSVSYDTERVPCSDTDGHSGPPQILALSLPTPLVDVSSSGGSRLRLGSRNSTNCLHGKGGAASARSHAPIPGALVQFACPKTYLIPPKTACPRHRSHPGAFFCQKRSNLHTKVHMKLSIEHPP